LGYVNVGTNDTILIFAPGGKRPENSAFSITGMNPYLHLLVYQNLKNPPPAPLMRRTDERRMIHSADGQVPIVRRSIHVHFFCSPVNILTMFQVGGERPSQHDGEKTEKSIVEINVLLVPFS
jgi:hypothetical protein